MAFSILIRDRFILIFILSAFLFSCINKGDLKSENNNILEVDPFKIEIQDSFLLLCIDSFLAEYGSDHLQSHILSISHVKNVIGSKYYLSWHMSQSVIKYYNPSYYTIIPEKEIIAVVYTGMQSEFNTKKAWQIIQDKISDILPDDAKLYESDILKKREESINIPPNYDPKVAEVDICNKKFTRYVEPFLSGFLPCGSDTTSNPISFEEIMKLNP